MTDAGFHIERLGEPRTMAEQAEDDHDVQDACVVAYFLHVRARKPAV